MSATDLKSPGAERGLFIPLALRYQLSTQLSAGLGGFYNLTTDKAAGGQKPNDVTLLVGPSFAF